MFVTALGHYSAEVISDDVGIRRIAEGVRTLSGSHVVLAPEFFLASVDNNLWKPHVVTIRSRDRLVGVVYFKEKRIAGLETGLLYADETMGTMVAARIDEYSPVLEVALKCLLSLPVVRGLRMAIPSERLQKDLLQRVALSRDWDLEICDSQAQTHSRLVLPETYETFLNALRPRARRNFRYYRRRSQEAGDFYCEAVTLDECRRAAYELARQSSISCRIEQLKRALDMVAAVPRPMLAGLRDRSGAWLSVAGGWSDARGATLMFQLNRDREHRKDSLSTVIRAYLIESLIQKGIREVWFWGGTAGALSGYVEAVPGVQVYLDVPTLLWRTVRLLVGAAAKSLPDRLAAIAQWVTPERGLKTSGMHQGHRTKWGHSKPI
jgi:hypothetical protein